MTSHELASILLAGYDLPVVFSVYTGGEDELEEVEHTALVMDGDVVVGVELLTYVPQSKCL